ncbi:protoporphyrinogen oxidase [Bacillus sp. CGMCC 1.16607]|uniref:protoporphyrinogen oxidase n=1 Tax=Bacillus sp. CGMCC 1.16607 TaxID=3351842 RepID=UPI003631D5E7
MEDTKKVVVIGGGITGLSAAFYLQKEARENNLPLDIKLIEASHRLGGKMQTVVQDGYTIERGPDSFLGRKQSMSRLVKAVGLEDKLISNTSGKSYVLVNQRLHPMPGGAVMGIPTQIAPFITTGLFSVPGKLRAAADFILPKSNEKEDQALGAFFRRRLGDEVVENLIEPLLSGIYAGDIDQLSLMSTFPQFYQVEQKYRSLIYGMRKSTPPRPKISPSEKKEKGIFLTLTTGLQSLADRVEELLEPHSVLKGYKVEEVVKHSDQKYRIELNNGEILDADCIVVSVGHQIAQSLFSKYEFFNVFKEMPSTSVATVALAFPKEAISKDIEGTGFVVSRNSDYTITACTWTHKKWPHSTPNGKVLLRCYVGRAGDEAVVDLSDDQITKIVLDDLKKTMDISMEPEFSIVTRWKEAMPQYTVGHKKRIESVNQGLKTELPGVFLAGGSYEGLGLPDCIDQGEAAVKKVLSYLKVSEKNVVTM